MRDKLEDIVEITRGIIHGYYRGDLEPWFSRLCSKSVWLGTGARALFGDQAIRSHFESYIVQPPIEICREEYYPIPFNSRYGAVAAEVTVGDKKRTDTTVSVTYAFVYQVLAGETKLVLLHVGQEVIIPPTKDGAPVMQMPAFRSVRDILLDLSETKRIPIPIGTQTLYVQPHMIFYVQSRNRKAEVYCADKVIQSSLSINEINELLPFDFCPIHRCYTVNTRYVTAIRRYEVTMATGEKLPIPIHGFNEVKADLERRIAGEDA